MEQSNPLARDDSPPQNQNQNSNTRTNILNSFLRGRPRNSSQSHINTDIRERELSPSPPQPPSPGVNHHRRNRPAIITASIQPSPSVTTPTASSGLGISHMLRRRRSAGNIASPSITTNHPPNPITSISANASPAMPHPPNALQSLLSPAGGTSLATSSSAPARPLSTILPSTTSLANAFSNLSPAVPLAPGATPAPGSHRIRLVPHLDSRRTLRFDAIGRDLREGDPPLRIGRFTDRSGIGLAAVNALGSNKLAFKSKVVSRAHAEIWVEVGGKFFIRDTKSSSGTFLNHVRLSPANSESKPYQMKDGDILQLGVDYQGGAEDIYKSVKIRVEVGREWQATHNAFNTNALKNLKTLAVAPNKAVAGAVTNLKPSGGKSQIPDCCICLFSVTIRQALFIAPCSHTFHYKCIRPLLETHHPAFSCPLCRTFADLEEDVEVEGDNAAWEDSDLEVEGDAEGVGREKDGGGTMKRERETETEREAGMETETEGDNPGPNPRTTRARRSRHADEEEVLMRLQEEDGDGDGMMVDVARPDNDRVPGEERDSDGDVGGSGGGSAGGTGTGNGSGEGEGMDSGAEMGMVMVVGEEDVEDVDGTVGGKRKR